MSFNTRFLTTRKERIKIFSFLVVYQNYDIKQKKRNENSGSTKIWFDHQVG